MLVHRAWLDAGATLLAQCVVSMHDCTAANVSHGRGIHQLRQYLRFAPLSVPEEVAVTEVRCDVVLPISSVCWCTVGAG